MEELQAVEKKPQTVAGGTTSNRVADSWSMNLDGPLGRECESIVGLLVAYTEPQEPTLKWKSRSVWSGKGQS